MTLWISKIGMHFMSSNQWTRWLTSRLPILVSLIKMLSTDWRMNNPVDNQKQGMKMLRDCRRSTEAFDISAPPNPHAYRLRTETNTLHLLHSTPTKIRKKAKKSKSTQQNKLLSRYLMNNLLIDIFNFLPFFLSNLYLKENRQKYLCERDHSCQTETHSLVKLLVQLEKTL